MYAPPYWATARAQQQQQQQPLPHPHARPLTTAKTQSSPVMSPAKPRVIRMTDASVDVRDAATLEERVKRVARLLVYRWHKRELSSLSFSVMTGGITNALYHVKADDEEDFTGVLVRCYGKGTELIIDHKRELEVLRELEVVGFGPRVRGQFNNGYVYDFVSGVPLTAEQLKEEPYASVIAARVAAFHKLNLVSATEKCVIVDKTRGWAAKLTREREESTYPEAKVVAMLNWIEACAATFPEQTVLCHTDLLCANFIWNEEKGTVSIIDYEYAAAGHCAFDIGNHFNEFGGFECNFTEAYPSAEFQHKWLTNYLTTLIGAEPSDDSVLQFRIMVSVYALLSQLYWGIWGLVQAEHSEIAFDYEDYGRMRIAAAFEFYDRFVKEGLFDLLPKLEAEEG